ncbi:MAG: glycosyltransferase family 2 protein [Bacillota bacterium]
MDILNYNSQVVITISDKISIVIPVFNGEKSLEDLYKKLIKNLNEITEKFEIIMVDDSSSDNSYNKILSLHKKDSRVKGIKLAKNFGQQNAIICGFNFAGGEYIITMDDDLQHNPKDIKKLYNKIKQGYDIVYAVPQNRDYGYLRKIGSKLTDYLFKLISSKPDNIRVSSYRILTKKLLNKIINNNYSFVYISALVLEQDVNIANIEVSHYNRKHGKSNYNIFKLIKLFFKLFIYYARFPLFKIFRKKGNQFLIEDMKF